MPNFADMFSGPAGRSGPMRAESGLGRLQRLSGFGSNPGELAAHAFVPEHLADGAPLVVVLHGCTQTAAEYDLGAGWSQMAERHGFAVLFPEQRRSNNPNLCFNWFLPEDSTRGSGEALSIRQMVAAMLAQSRLDPARVFVTGLSAGGAMASVMLATYPEVFAGGAIIAGLPYGCANSVPEAFELMRGQRAGDDQRRVALVRGASDHSGPWPTVSVWHGTADATVNPSNAEAIIGQWRSLHGVGTKPDRLDAVDGYPRRVWRDAAGRDVIEAFSITGMGHGTPLSTKGEDRCGQAGSFMLEASISSTHQICRFWGLIKPQTNLTRSNAPSETRVTGATAPSALQREPALEAQETADRPTARADMIRTVIEDALRSAGLMR